MITDVWKYRGKSTGELRSSVCYAIKTGVFDYAKQFPSSRNLEKFGEARQDLTIKELAEKFLALKETEVAKTSLNTYRAVIKNILSIIGEKNLASSINKEKLLEVRKELLTGYQIPGFAPIFPDICYHLTHYKPAAADIPVASDNPAHYADAIRYNARTPLQGSLLPLTRLVWA
ncbi:hypothetical protein DHB4_07865 [Escherichia coli K-12]|nr:hypothetical protein DHB4_07865 [Escherichia coli K-12]AMH35005.1 hypothetical protein C3026_09090 [Escherichia coli K-12]